MEKYFYSLVAEYFTALRFEVERGGFGEKVFEAERTLHDFISRNSCDCIDWSHDTEGIKELVNLLGRLFDFMCSKEKVIIGRTAHYFEISSFIGECLDRSEEKQRHKDWQTAMQVTNKIKERGLQKGIADEVSDIVYTLVPLRNDREKTEHYLRDTLMSDSGRSLHHEELRDAILSVICDDSKFSFGYAYYFLSSWKNRTSGGVVVDDCNMYANEESVNYSLWYEERMAEIEQADDLHKLELAQQARRSPIHINMATDHKLRSTFDAYLNLIISDYTAPYSQPQQRTKQRSTQQILSEEFGSEQARTYFERAIEAGLMNEEYKWIATKRLLACFCREMSKTLDMGKGVDINGQKRLSWKPFEDLFELKKGCLRATLNDIQKTGVSPIGIERIDNIFLEQ